MPDSLVQNLTAPKTAAGSGDRGVPLAPAQQAALLPERLHRRPAANLFIALELTGDVDPSALDRALIAVLTEHAILRSVFPDDRRIPYQRVVDAPASVLEIGRSVADDTDLELALAQDAEHRFDLVAGLPLRVRLYRLPGRDVLSIVAHPIAADDRSVELFVAALFAAYAGAEPGAAKQFADFVPAQLKALAATAANDPALAYWTERLAELPARVPVTSSTPGIGIARRVLTMPSETLAALRVHADGDAAAVFAALAAAALRDTGLGDDVLVGLTDPARSAEAAEVVGPFANHLVLRIAPNGRTPKALIAETAETVAQARAQAGPRVERITHLLRGTAALADGALFQALLTVRDAAPVALSSGGVQVREVARRSARPHGVDIVMDLALGADGATLTLDFPIELAGRPEIGAFATRFAQRASAWAEAADAVIDATPDERPLFTPASDDDLLEIPTAGLGGEPQTDAERVIAAAIRKVLDLDEDDDLGREDTFFSLGGDSIAALRLVTDLAEQGHVLDVQTVFAYPAVYELAEQLENGAGKADSPAQPAAQEVAPMSASGLDAAALSALGRKFGAK
ncbi:condensation domain-containing protein [Nocardia cyriacigeorgica]|uniref:condensation domain-containing protein n=1 Tax=Nocardia cyriacigeorgica TaxID=135487 RepID=UPI002456F159|nr:condensation domain-containing protein [Nocardia cyriacigeorgica]